MKAAHAIAGQAVGMYLRIASHSDDAFESFLLLNADVNRSRASSSLIPLVAG
jgi:hypothetical protein